MPDSWIGDHIMTIAHNLADVIHMAVRPPDHRFRRVAVGIAVMCTGALVCGMGAGLLNAPVATARVIAGEPPVQVHRSLDMQVSSHDGWSGSVRVGALGRIEGQRRTWRGMPISIMIYRQTCDITGCTRTEISTLPERPVSGMANVGAGLVRATLPTHTLPVRVTTTHRGRVLGDSTAVLAVTVRAQRKGQILRETTVVDGLRLNDRQWAEGEGVVTILGEEGDLLTLESSKALIQVTRLAEVRER
jgi:hypothetical protein